ncbi:M20/M25/M40 family metallo-hydrolase [Humitalea sp. 24SJ18S-53]|uniref:M20/M25/M40 family metallo-hydrolase n=1 Tax=Humitalea sp. 24SJ18S-53 TaxID=3422307 RepID=UPI003D6787A0
MTARQNFIAAALSRTDQVVAVAQKLIAVASPNPPGDVRAAAEAAASIVSELIPSATLTLHPTGPDVTNLVAIVHGARPGKRVVFNGHLDTYPVNEALPWTVPPLGGLLRGGKLYGRGAADMKGGIAASIVALALLAEHRADWAGQAVLTLAGDEESMGPLGTAWLLKNIPEARGDATIIGDAGSPRVLRFGEKGFWWLEVEATGRAAHGAHVHLGDNAIDRLSVALDVLRSLRALPVSAPPGVTAAIAASRPISEPLSGEGESQVLGSVTVNIGQVSGGTAPNLVPASARATADIRLPVGVSGATLGAALHAALDPLPGITWRALRQFEPNHTDPANPVVQTLHRVAEEILSATVAVNMRVGGSDARWFRMEDLPTVVYGPTPFNMGGADEYVLVDELAAVMRVHALAAFDILQ